MAYVKPERAAQMADDLDRWCKDHGFKIKLELATLLGIDRPAWTTISSGKAFYEGRNPPGEPYALLFKFTGIPSLDPRTLPPKVKVIPSTGERLFIPRAWTEEQWQEWNQTTGQKIGKGIQHMPSGPPSRPKPPETEKTHKEPKPSPQVQAAPTKQTVGGIIDSILAVLFRQQGAALAEALAPVLQATIRQELERVSSDAPRRSVWTEEERQVHTNISVLAHHLTELLKPYKTGTGTQRDQLIRDHNAAISELWATLAPLTLPKKDREKVLSQPQIKFDLED